MIRSGKFFGAPMRGAQKIGRHKLNEEVKK